MDHLFGLRVSWKRLKRILYGRATTWIYVQLRRQVLYYKKTYSAALKLIIRWFQVQVLGGPTNSDCFFTLRCAGKLRLPKQMLTVKVSLNACNLFVSRAT